MTNVFDTISAEANLRDEITVKSDEFDPAAGVPEWENDDLDHFSRMPDDENESDEFESANRREMDLMNVGWPGDGSGENDFEDYNANEADDYRDE